MMPMTLEETAAAVRGRLVPPDGRDSARSPVSSVVSDSRRAQAGSLFVAIRGDRVDGHDFLPAAAESGAIAALVDHDVPNEELARIIVPDTVKALGLLARSVVDRRRSGSQGSPFTVVGITGSVGKTTTKDMLHALLRTMGPTVAPVGSFNNEIGLPLTVCEVGSATRFLIAEMGANHVGEIAGLTRVVPPDIAVVLKVGVAHLGEFGSVERIAQAKGEIVQGLVPHGAAVLNAGDARVSAMRRLAPGDVLWFGLEGDPAHPGMLVGSDVDVDDSDRPSFLMSDGRSSARVQLGIPGRHNVANALAAATVAVRLGMRLDQAAEVLSSLTSISPHRMALGKVRESGVGFTLIDDSFNANPDSTKAGVDGLVRWHAGLDASDGPRPFRIAVLGAMLELGDDEEELHERTGAYAVGAGVDAVIAVGSAADPHVDALAGSLARGARAAAETGRVSVDWVHGAQEADESIVDLVRVHPNAVVLLKGSHASGLSELAERWTSTASR
ncbi:UDP-N-acetylmuramoyl-tripeptide--D-alanyl-D-alanine ligase [uncultured Bifidobacterium sp.]|uniref:UDP-N-acetylmuramoyl-tripeptide--D-alanyl-D- alanine ligase n=1 Tax=uncultured Bifidobacterium sp. TaxID=165187 RepID=UPI0028DD0E42|nr:UDP-N-acetylmuramoyl-tripeptide--D-alanyl-D-alanine ligase [uncultured Bifidobacterium sp.]